MLESFGSITDDPTKKEKQLNRTESDKTLGKKLGVNVPLRPELRGEEASNYSAGGSKDYATPRT